ncbi:hypothetical protein J7E24_17185 [Hymenobacter sp. ISL-91]|uniref:hypothetical protein n=1 Tax=Hymenobacter sp. ISL-91 TaxID=2819151 RepID=UPI001BED37E8|nr:hypothetical protein [Hymenobacter sp. ISL-91]MBT2559521.1 hypothetical protein [Hymenobacter sp. ISL-91]
MKKKATLSLLTVLFCVIGSFSQSNPTSSIVGSWHITLTSTENYCSGPAGIQEFPTGKPEKQTWTISQDQDVYTLSTPGMVDLKGNLKDGQFYFNRFSSGTDPEPARQVVFTIGTDDKLIGKVNLAPKAETGICIIRYSFTGKK